MKNPFRKSRKPGNAYVTVIDPRSGWKYEVLKLYKSLEASQKDPFARAFCNVHGVETEMGDVYLKDIPLVYPMLVCAKAAMSAGEE